MDLDGPTGWSARQLFCCAVAAKAPPLSEGGFGGVDRLVKTRASDQMPEKLRIMAVAVADTPPNPPSERGGPLAATAQQNDCRAGDPVGPSKAKFSPPHP